MTGLFDSPEDCTTASERHGAACPRYYNSEKLGQLLQGYKDCAGSEALQAVCRRVGVEYSPGKVSMDLSDARELQRELVKCCDLRQQLPGE